MLSAAIKMGSSVSGLVNVVESIIIKIDSAKDNYKWLKEVIEITSSEYRIFALALNMIVSSVRDIVITINGMLE